MDKQNARLFSATVVITAAIIGGAYLLDRAYQSAQPGESRESGWTPLSTRHPAPNNNRHPGPQNNRHPGPDPGSGTPSTTPNGAAQKTPTDQIITCTHPQYGTVYTNAPSCEEADWDNRISIAEPLHQTPGQDRYSGEDYQTPENEAGNISNTANELGHTRPTIDRHLSILEKLFLVRRLPAWHSNRSKRLVKTPKVHLCDSGLAAALSDLRPEQWNPERTRFGHLLESFVVQQLIAMGTWHEGNPRFYHYRDKDQVEVDLVIETGGGIWGVEVKAAASVQPRDGKGLRRLAETAKGNFRGGLVLYDGEAVLPLDKQLNLLAVPLAKLWEL